MKRIILISLFLLSAALSSLLLNYTVFDRHRSVAVAQTLTPSEGPVVDVAQAPTLNDPNATMKVVNANAFIGLVAVDTNRDGETTVEAGDKLGISCAICHTVTDNKAS